MSAMNLSNFSLLKEDSDNYHVGHPKGKSMVIPKKGLSNKAQELISKLKKNKNFADGGDVNLDDVLDSDAAPQPQASQAPDTPDFVAEDQPAPKMTAADEQGANATDSTSAANPQAAQASPQDTPTQPQQQQAPTMGSSGDMDSAVQNTIGTEQAGVNAEQRAGKQQQQALHAYNAQMQDMTSPADKFAEYQAKDQKLEDAVANKSIDPDRYWNNKSTGSKIASTLGVIISGMGAGNGGTNQALENLRQHAQADIDAQKADQSKNMNLWKMNREMMGSDLGADLATQNQYNAIAQGKLKEAAAGALGPQAAANAAPAILALQQQRAMNNQRLGLMQWAKQPGISNQNPAQLVNQLVPKEQQAKALEEVGNMQQAVQLKKDLIQSYNDLNHKMMGGAFSPADRASAINAYGGILAKLSEGRFNLEESKNQMDALLPARFEDTQTSKNKMVRIDNFFDGLVKTPTLDANMIPVKKFQGTNLDTVNNSYLPGSVLNIKGKQYKVGRDGDSLSPV